MTVFEFKYRALRYFTLPLHQMVYQQLKNMIRLKTDLEILDVGGRKSHYTIGLPCKVTISDVERESDIQKQLHLGITEDMVSQVIRRRSNISSVIIDDLTDSKLPDSSYDMVVAIEVLEHVERDDKFVENVRRILKPDGVFFMTTPNGDYVKNTNPDHIRHYQKEQLNNLLQDHFQYTRVDYAVADGKLHKWGLSPWAIRRPLKTVRSMLANALGYHLDQNPRLKYSAKNTMHLFAYGTDNSQTAWDANMRLEDRSVSINAI